MLQNEILEKLVCFTDEEIDLLNGRKSIDKSIFLNDHSNIIDYHKILMDDQQLSVRKHVRFCEYPKHKHNYIELMYVYGGKMTHIIDEREITIHEGEILLLNQNTEHSIKFTDENDIIFNFIIKPEFLDFLSTMVEQENEVLNFFFDALYSYDNDSEYLLFKVQDNILIKNYIESIITQLYQPSLNKSLELKLLVGLLLTELMNHPETIEVYTENSYEKMVISTILKYVLSHYQNGSLNDLSNKMNIPNYTISRMIKKVTGKTYKELIQNVRFEKVISFLDNTDLSIERIIEEVGYENASYFYRAFKKKYGMTPNEYRIAKKDSI